MAINKYSVQNGVRKRGKDERSSDGRGRVTLLINRPPKGAVGDTTRYVGESCKIALQSRSHLTRMALECPPVVVIAMARPYSAEDLGGFGVC